MGHFLGFQYNVHILMLKQVQETKLIFIRPFITRFRKLLFTAEKHAEQNRD